MGKAGRLGHAGRTGGELNVDNFVVPEPLVGECAASIIGVSAAEQKVISVDGTDVFDVNSPL